MSKLKVTCDNCGSENVRLDAFAMWDKAKQDWVLDSTYDTSWCIDCEGEHDITYEEIK